MDGAPATHAVDEFLDAFYARDGTDRWWMVGERPPLVGDAFVDAFVGGVGEHLSRRWGMDPPPWTAEPPRYLRRAVFHPDVPGYRRWMMAVTPVAFRARLIFTGPEPLQRARFPYGMSGGGRRSGRSG